MNSIVPATPAIRCSPAREDKTKAGDPGQRPVCESAHDRLIDDIRPCLDSVYCCRGPVYRRDDDPRAHPRRCAAPRSGIQTAALSGRFRALADPGVVENVACEQTDQDTGHRESKMVAKCRTRETAHRVWIPAMAPTRQARSHASRIIFGTREAVWGAYGAPPAPVTVRSGRSSPA